MVGPVNQRLGYRNKTLSVKSVKLMWDMCRWGRGHRETKPAVFSRYEMSWRPEDDYDHDKSWPWSVLGC